MGKEERKFITLETPTESVMMLCVIVLCVDAFYKSECPERSATSTMEMNIGLIYLHIDTK
tara:strand:+ start:84 stop:263 length:180 start_codon:yes stop_codon:yes gene_type:complete